MALSLTQKAGWGLADMGIVVFVVVKQLLVLAFLTNYLGVPIGLAGAVTTAVLLFDIITDPLIGYLSDRTQSRFGRRAPCLAIFSLFLAVPPIWLFPFSLCFSTLGNLAFFMFFFLKQITTRTAFFPQNNRWEWGGWGL